MKENLTNAGKKEQRQIDRTLEKEYKEGPIDENAPRQGKEAEARTVPKQHSTRKQHSK
jgi:hypothetical protein